MSTRYSARTALRILNRWAPIFIAVLALLVSLDQAWQTRKHDKLSVRPYVYVSFRHSYEEGAGWTYSNFGLGPAILKSFEVRVDGVPQVDWEGALRSLAIVEGGPDKPATEWTVPRVGAVMEPGEPKKLFWMRPGRFTRPLMDNQERVEIKICYCSFYDECWIGGTPQVAAAKKDRCPSDIPPFRLPGVITTPPDDP